MRGNEARVMIKKETSKIRVIQKEKSATLAAALTAAAAATDTNTSDACFVVHPQQRQQEEDANENENECNANASSKETETETEAIVTETETEIVTETSIPNSCNLVSDAIHNHPKTSSTATEESTESTECTECTESIEATHVATETTRKIVTTKWIYESKPKRPKRRPRIVHVVTPDLQEELYIKRLLARRSFHLPHHGVFQDFIQFIKNNHTVVGLCCHDRLHPLRFGHRLFIFIGSLAFGLTATNSVYLWYAYSNEDMNQVLIQVSLGNSDNATFQFLNDLEITYGMVALWTMGSILHSMFDITLWFLTACICFLEGGACGKYSRLRSVGSYMTIAIVAVMVALSSFVIAGRAIYESRLSEAQMDINNSSSNNITDILVSEEEEQQQQWSLDGLEFQSFSFLLGFGVESLLAYFVYFPIIVTIGFSGMLEPFFRCMPCIKFLGGRKREVARQLQERLDMRERRRQLFENIREHGDIVKLIQSNDDDNNYHDDRLDATKLDEFHDDYV